eukprot:s3523_g11.t2
MNLMLSFAGLEASRRMCNLPYVSFIVSLNAWVLALLGSVDLLAGRPRTAMSLSVAGVSDSMLPVFLFANLLTGDRWWNALQGLDQELKVPDVLLAEMTLSNSGLSEDQRLMIRTMLQGRVTTGNVATEVDTEVFTLRITIPTEEHEVPVDDEVLGYVAETQYDDMTEGDDEGFLVMNFALFVRTDWTCRMRRHVLWRPSHCSWSTKRTCSVAMGGFQAQRQFDISGNVSFHERKARLAQLKSRTECRRCGAKGHWSGDAVCPKGGRKGGSKKSSGASTASTKSPSMAGGKSGGKPPKPRVVYFSHRGGDSGTDDGWSYMAIKTEPNEKAKDKCRGARPKAKGACIPPPTSLLSGTLLQSSMASSSMPS